MVRLKHYKGLLNLQKFTRIEPTEEETYIISSRARKSVDGDEPSNIKKEYIIKCYTPEGYGGLATVISYGTNKKARDEDWLMIMQLVCENLNQSFDVVNDVESIQESIQKLTESTEEFKNIVANTKKQIGKMKK